MEGAETYMGGSERSPNVSICDEETRELQDTISRCMPHFYRRAYRYLGNAADAEDAVQDALLSAYKHLDQFKAQAQMSTWLTVIVTNCALTQLRKRPRQTPLSLEDRFKEDRGYVLSERLEDQGPSPEDEYTTVELHGRFMDIVEELPASLRKAFQLREVKGLSTSEAAQILGVAESTVKAQLSRARAQLRRLMCRALEQQPPPALTSAALSVAGEK
jgi:RNA polymerase sigma-70 factor, ECF subfamily